MNAIKVIVLGVIVLGSIAIYRNAKGATPQAVQVLSTSPTKAQTSPEVIADNLQIPWSLVFLPDKSILFTERPGRVRLISSTNLLQESPAFVVKDVKTIGEGGLLGLVIHPNFAKNHYLYLYYTYSGNEDQTENKVVRYTYTNGVFSNEKVIVDKIPGSANHNGGRLKFGPDGFLYITTGDSQNPSLAQDKASLAGKILRVTDDGKNAPGNPFGNLIYSYGHRNPQGLAWDSEGRLWSTEHGSSAGDEVNLIKIGKNYGWPTITKSETKAGMETPTLNSGSDTWAPSGLVYQKPYLYFAGLRSSNLFRLGTNTMKLDVLLKGKYGRLRDVTVGPDGFLYITTSNMDGRALTHLDGDKIIRIDPYSFGVSP